MKQSSKILFTTLFALALSVGAARVDITPRPDPANPPTGKYEHERLYVRAIVLDNGSVRAALIGADQSGLSEEAWSAASKQIATELDCPVGNILMSATHTHSGMAAGDVPGARWIPSTRTGRPTSAYFCADFGCHTSGQS